MQYAVRDEEFIPWGGPEKTLAEKWNTGMRVGHWYGASTEFATESLGAGDGRSCLVIGSPLVEADALKAKGWDVTYLDVREPPVRRWKLIQADATDIPCPDNSFDAVSSSCVLTHAGTGRYGDGHNRAHGDEVMLAQIARVLKPECYAALTFGAVIDRPRMVRLGHIHRVYTVKECRRMLEVAGLTLVRMNIWGVVQKRWLTEKEVVSNNLDSPDYISFLVAK